VGVRTGKALMVDIDTQAVIKVRKPIRATDPKPASPLRVKIEAVLVTA
jgi:hypothetical protein